MGIGGRGNKIALRLLKSRTTKIAGIGVLDFFFQAFNYSTEKYIFLQTLPMAIRSVCESNFLRWVS